MIKFRFSSQFKLLEQVVVCHGIWVGGFEFKSFSQLYLPIKKVEIPLVGLHLLSGNLGSHVRGGVLDLSKSG